MADKQRQALIEDMKELRKLEEIENQIKKRKAKNSYINYVEYVHRGYWLRGKHLEYLCNKIELLLDNNLYDDEGNHVKILIVSMPPQHGKSQCITETLPSWILGNNPNKRVIIVSYNTDFARRFGRRNVAKIKEHGKELFDIELSKETDDEFEIKGRIGSCISRGIMSGITGNPADCLPKGTMISTEIGEIEISQLVAMKNPPLVLSYNHKNDKIEPRRIIAQREIKASEFTTIKTVCGNKVKSTREHRYYEKERGYTEASLLNRGDKLISLGDERVPYMQEGETSGKSGLQEVLRRSKKILRSFNLQLLWKGVRKRALRIRESLKKKSNRFLLLETLHEHTFCGKVKRKMQGLWKIRKKGEHILLKTMQRNLQSSQITEEAMWHMQIRKRWASMRLLWSKGNKTNENKFESSSYRRKPSKQYFGEFNNNVPRMSFEASQVKTDAVYRIENTSEDSIPVYDIQIEGNHNFFANGILVHNCVIIDDPIKNREEADSETYREKMWEEYLNSVKTRLSANGVIILIQTRWHDDDLAGRIIQHEGNKVMTINFPCEAEESDILGRDVGDALFPEIGKGKEWLEDFKRSYITQEGNRTWQALFQGKPTALEGNMLKRSWWQYYDIPPTKFSRMVQSWDCSFKDSDTSDFVVGQVWGMVGIDCYLIDMVRARLNLPDTIIAIEAMHKKYPDAKRILIEDKANGSAVIQILQKKISGIIPVEPQGGKIARASAVSPHIESGHVFLPKHAAFTSLFVDECSAFPNGTHDDIVDSFSQGINKLMYYHNTEKEEVQFVEGGTYCRGELKSKGFSDIKINMMVKQGKIKLIGK